MVVNSSIKLLKIKVCKFGKLEFLELFNNLFQVKLVSTFTENPEILKSFFYVDKTTRVSQRNKASKLFSKCKDMLSKGNTVACEELLS